jgi:nucleoside-diphosphate-sugar epimerase
MKILVTGGAGYIGSRLVPLLLFRGHEVKVLDILNFGGESLMGYLGNPNFSLSYGDIRSERNILDALSSVECVVHLASIVGEDACKVDEKAAHEVNELSNELMVKCINKCPVKKFIFISTCSNYGVSEPNILVDEFSPLNPLSAYAKAKVNAEQIYLTELSATAVSILRFGTICGLSPRMRFDLLINEMARDVVLGRPINIFAPEAWRPFLHIDDAALAIHELIMAHVDLIKGRVFNVVGENHQKTSLIDIARRYRSDSNIAITNKKPDLRDYRVSGDLYSSIFPSPSRSVEDAFIEVAFAVKNHYFRNPIWPGHSAISEMKPVSQ